MTGSGLRRRALSLVLLIGALTAALPAAAAAVTAQSFRILHRFQDGADGDDPLGGLVRDRDGRLYGTTYYGGLSVYGGLVYMLTPPKTAGGGWGYRVIYRFGTAPDDGQAPSGALTVRGGVIYGTLHSGADTSCGCGAVFRLRPLNAAKTRWKYSVISRFHHARDGSGPAAGVVFGKDGALYGTTADGGAHRAGTVFRLTGQGDGPWTRETLFDFPSWVGGAAGPEGELAVDPADGSLYGTTFGGGRHNQGRVFRLVPAASGPWTMETLHDFRPSYDRPPDGSLPRGRLFIARDGAVWGTTEAGDRGGHWNGGTIYRLKRKPGGGWSYRIVHEFIGGPGDGFWPKSGLTPTGRGDFYGTTAGGGARGAGTLYRLFKAPSGAWKTEVVHSFDHAAGGDAPWTQPVLAGKLLAGTTLEGGSRACSTGCGTVWLATLP